jgi:dTDP-4-amino-4,6-dideoxygalactose transaminase
LIEFNNFSREYSSLGDEINSVIKEVISSGKYILNDRVSEFEKNFSNYLDVQHCVAVASGTDALTISLIALGIGPGDEVITSGMTAYPTIIGILNSGAKPVLVDINLDNILINAEKIEDVITDKTKAIIPVHLYGQSCNMDKIIDISNKFNLHIIEDCAQSTGTLYKNKMTGTIGSCGAFSFYPTKNLGCYGDGGAITTNNDEIYSKAKLLRNYGQGSSYQYNINGMNSRLDELQAAVLSKKLKYLNIWNNRRNDIAKKYIQDIKNLTLLAKDPNSSHSYHLFVGRSNDRKKLSKYLKENGVQTLVHYPISINEQVAFKEYKSKILNNAYQASKEIISLPINPWLKDDEVDFIIETINNF